MFHSKLLNNQEIYLMLHKCDTLRVQREQKGNIVDLDGM